MIDAVAILQGRVSFRRTRKRTKRKKITLEGIAEVFRQQVESIFAPKLNTERVVRELRDAELRGRSQARTEFTRPIAIPQVLPPPRFRIETPETERTHCFPGEDEMEDQ